MDLEMMYAGVRDEKHTGVRPPDQVLADGRDGRIVGTPHKGGRPDPALENGRFEPSQGPIRAVAAAEAAGLLRAEGVPPPVVAGEYEQSRIPVGAAGRAAAAAAAAAAGLLR